MPENAQTSAIVPYKQPSTRYEQELWDYIFEIWLYLADRNCAATYDKMLEELEDSPIFDADIYPSVRQIQYKRKKDNWDLRANNIIRSEARNIDETQMARMLVMGEKALDLAEQLITGQIVAKDRNDAQLIAIRWDAAKEMLRFRGLGTAGTPGKPTLEITVKTDDNKGIDLKGMTPDEKAEFWRQRTLEDKEHKKLTGHDLKR
jgi:hypothetical protein